MIKRVLFVLSLFVCSATFAQGVDPLHNISGTAGSAGTASPWVRSGSGAWSFLHAFDAHVTYVSETGPEEQRDEIFSTNWFAAGAQRTFGERGFVLLRGRMSLEPYTVSDDGYPQMLQYAGEPEGPLVDHMRAHDLFGEAAVDLGWRPTQSTMLHLYGALVGDPALGPPPAHLRSSGVDFAEAPFGYDIEESFNDSTKVVTAGFATSLVTIEASVFHDAFTTGKHTELDNGDIDSKSARLTITPGSNLAIQVSRGELGEEATNQRTITSASLTYGSNALAFTALWTQREVEDGDAMTAYGGEIAFRGTRNTVMGRAEWVDRPAGFPELPTPVTGERESSTHFAVGYIFDFVRAPSFKTGAGVNIDYHTQSHDLPERYGHKPQSIYAFVRIRTR
jgi:hypothetical protein